MNIDNKIRADLFRNRIEDKNQLTGAGAIYVGTGIPKYIDSTGATTGTPSTGTIGPFYETVGITPTTGGQVPVSVMGTGSAEATGTVAGLKFKSVNDAMKSEDGSILLAASGISVRSSNGITFLNEDAVDTDISIINKTRDISVNAAKNVSIEGQTKTKISNVSLDTNLKGPTTGSLYIAPSGSASLGVDGVTGTYSSDTKETNLAPIIYNIGQRLDSLGFKEGTVYDPSGTVSILKLTKIGYYVLATLLQSITLDNGVTSYWFETGAIPEDFRRLSEKPDAKELFVLKTDYMITTGGEQHSTNNRNFAIEYMGEHTFQFNADYISSTGVSYIRGIFNKGTTFGYDIRE